LINKKLILVLEFYGRYISKRLQEWVFTGI